MRKGWEVKKLGEVCEMNPPKKEIKNQLQDDDLVSFIPMEDLGVLTKDINVSKERLLKEVYGSYTYFRENDVLLAKITPCFENGKIGIARNLKNNVGFGSSEYFVFRTNRELIPDYLFYFLSSELFRRNGEQVMTGAVGHKRVPKDFIENLEIPYPKSILEQQHIVDILNETFTVISNLKEHAEKNMQNTRELFNSYLQSVFSYLVSRWDKVRIEDVCESIIDCINKTAPVVEGPTPYKMIRTTNVRDGKVNLDSVKYVTENVYNAWTRRQIPVKGDVLFTREAPLGECGMLLTDDKVFLGQRLVSYRVDVSKLDNRFLLYAFQSNDLKQQIQALASGATVQHMRVPDSKALRLVLPSLTEQRNIVAKLDELSVQTQKLDAIYKQKLVDLEELKQSILQKAFNGELTGV